MNQKSINLSGVTGDQIILDVTAGDRNQVFDYCLICSGAGTLILKDGATTEFGRYTFVNAGDGMVTPPVGAGASRFTAVGDLILNLSGTLSVTGHFTYASNG